MTISTSRRGFLKGAAAASGAALVLGFDARGLLAQGDDDALVTPFVRVAADGTVTVIAKHFEMGQGTTTGLATLIAEEMDVPLESMTVEWAPSNPEVYNNLFFGKFQGTGGSTAMANSWMQYRQAGAAAREMLIAAAAKDLGTDPASLRIENGRIVGSGNQPTLAAMADGESSVSLGRFVATASTLTPPAEPRLKTPAEFTLIGQPGAKRKDTPAKINGSAQFAMDLHLPGQMVVVLARTPQMGGKATAVDDSGARDVPGFRQAAILPGGAAVAVFADHTWAAIQSREALKIDWDMAAAETRSSDQIRDELMALLDAPAEFDARGTAADAAGIDGAAKVIEQTFYFPLLAHAPMEPLTCTIAPDTDGGITLHDGCQMPTAPHFALSKILGLPMEKVRIKTYYAGGSFGRRGATVADYQAEAALAFAATDRTKPVKLVWTREDDITGGHYRPAFAHKVRVGLDADGKITGWHHRIAGQSIIKGTAFEQALVENGVDATSVEGVADTHYAIPAMYTGLSDHKKATSVLWWRSVGHTHTGFVMETMMDEVARAAGQDPVAFRLALLPGDTPEQKRLAAVLSLAAEKGGWGKPAAGRMQGIAVHPSFGSFVAEVVEISGDAEAGVKIEKVTAAVDCGIAINPDIVKAQIESGVGYGLGAVMRNEITLEGGQVQQSNFPDYEPLRITDIGAIEVHVVPSAEAPSGIGEPGVPPAGPALANAIAAAGKRVTMLPLAANGVSFA